ncbi:MAG: spondin domain-containing protein [Myxococcota bacterium]
MMSWRAVLLCGALFLPGMALGACGDDGDGGEREDVVEDVPVDVEPDVVEDVPVDVEPDVLPDVDPDVEPDVLPDVDPDVEPDVEPDVDPDVEPDAEPDVGADVPPDTPTDVDPDVADADVGPTGSTFRVRVENVSGGFWPLPTPVAGGTWLTHTSEDPLFTPGEPAPDNGLEALAEDGLPTDLSIALAGQEGVTASDGFQIVGGGEPPLLPGDAYEAEITATPEDGVLSVAAMIVESNDVFVAPAGGGIPLFDQDGEPLPTRDVTDMLALWNAGTEVDERPGLGPWQAPRQDVADTGAPEGVVHAFEHGTRWIPPVSQIADFTVTMDTAAEVPTYVIRVDNVSAEAGGMMTPLAPVFWAVHDMTYSLFGLGGAPASAGLESLAEDGDPTGLVGEATADDGVASTGAAAEPVDDPGNPGTIAPGGAYELTVVPDVDHPWLTLAFMVVHSNDAFIGTRPQGVRLLSQNGDARPAADVEADLERLVALWDAGTEANEVPGVGPNQASSQDGPDQGPSDPFEDGVHRYDDATNDLAGLGVGGRLAVNVAAGDDPGTFDVTIANTGGDTAFPATFTPVLWALHDGTGELFTMGEAASASLESLAEDGDASVWDAALTDAGIPHGILDETLGGDPGPLVPDAIYTATLTPTVTDRYLTFFSMVVPSNDTFVSLGPVGVPLLDEVGDPRPDEDIDDDMDALLMAFDAGTEANQGGAMGPDMAPHQAAPNTGAPEGDGTVRAMADPIWGYPPLSELLRVTVEPVE